MRIVIDECLFPQICAWGKERKKERKKKKKKKKEKQTLNEIFLRMCLETRSGEWTISRKITKQKEQETLGENHERLQEGGIN